MEQRQPGLFWVKWTMKRGSNAALKFLLMETKMLAQAAPFFLAKKRQNV